MKDMPNLKKYMKKKGMAGDDPASDPTKLDMEDPKPAPTWKAVDPEGHGDISTDDFETEDTDNDPLEDKTGPESKKAESNLDKYQKMKKK